MAYYKVVVSTDIIKYFVVDKPKPHRGHDDLAFDTIPDGNWTIAPLAHNDEGKLIISPLEEKRLRDFAEEWHPLKIDFGSLRAGFPLCRRLALRRSSLGGYFSRSSGRGRAQGARYVGLLV